MTTESLSSPVSFPTLRVDVACPNCRSRGLKTFYGVSNIPVHSCLLMPSPAKAVEFPRGNLALGFCSSCGFIANTLFNPADNAYSSAYEETQGFSPTFNKFAKELAQRWIENHGLHNKRVLEIGCGKGEFLALLCELGPNSGIGIDPSYHHNRLTSSAMGRMTFYQELYAQKHESLEADFITCRHTLEHIAPTRDFMETIRSTIGQRKNVSIAFELPDVYRVLKEGAFWDIYYEHCTYFSAGSLARLFRSTGFEVNELSLDYDDQYLLIGGVPADGQTEPRLPLEFDLPDMIAAVEKFPKVVGDNIDHWRNVIGDIISRGKKVVLWGSGSKGVAFLTTIGITTEVEYVVDINTYRQGKFMPGTGHPIVGPQFMTEYRPDYVIIMNAIYTKEIGDQLMSMGVHAELLPV